MQHGEVRFYDVDRGYGFIMPANGGKDVFVHVKAISRAGLAPLVKGQVVQFELVAGRDGRVMAADLKLVPGAP
jgi:cold shock protein